MSLKKILNLRQNCPMCQTILPIVSVDLPGISIKYTDENIHVWLNKYPSNSITFNIDGTFKKTKQWKMDWVNPLSLSRRCLICGIDTIILKPRTLGYSTRLVKELSLYKYEQKFDLYRPQINENQEYIRSDILGEYLIFTIKQTKYTIKNNFVSNSATIKISKIDNSENTQTITTPIITLSSIESFNELVKKIKIYQLFS